MTTKDEALRMALAVVDRQAEDDGLWFVAVTAAEAYLQQELRRLTAVVEQCRAALDAPQPEPVAGVVIDGSMNTPALVKRGTEREHIAKWGGSLLYTSPPVREPLTDGQMDMLMIDVRSLFDHKRKPGDLGKAIVRAVERAHGIGAKP